MPSDPKVEVLQTALGEHYDLVCSGICPIPDPQRVLYYTDGGISTRIDFTNAGIGELEALYRACKPAEFGLNKESVIDTSYGKAREMDPRSFSTTFDPHILGIYEQVFKSLFVWSNPTMDMELYKLNVYGPGDFFNAHKGPDWDVVGTLVIILPTPHEGGQFVLRGKKKEWTLDFSDKFATATSPSACFVALYAEMKHEVLPITSGYRVTLTYKLHSKPIHPARLPVFSLYHQKLKESIANLVNDKTKLPTGGYLGFGLAHEYVHTGKKVLEGLLEQLKGADRALVDVCDALGLEYSLKLFYGDIIIDFKEGVNLLATREILAPSLSTNDEWTSLDYFKKATEVGGIEGFVFAGESVDVGLDEERDEDDDWLSKLYRDPIPEVLEIRNMKSRLDVRSNFMTFGDEPAMECFYGTACLMVHVDPAESRKPVVL